MNIPEKSVAKALPSARYALRPVGGGDGSAEALLDASEGLRLRLGCRQGFKVTVRSRRLEVASRKSMWRELVSVDSRGAFRGRA